MNAYTERKISALMGMLICLEVPKNTVIGIISFLKTEKMANEMFKALKASGENTTPQEAEAICLKVITENQ